MMFFCVSLIAVTLSLFLVFVFVFRLCLLSFIVFIVVFIDIIVVDVDLPIILIVSAWLWLPGWQDSHPLLMCTWTVWHLTRESADAYETFKPVKLWFKLHTSSCMVTDKYMQCFCLNLNILPSFDLNQPLCLDRVRSCGFRGPRRYINVRKHLERKQMSSKLSWKQSMSSKDKYEDK